MNTDTAGMPAGAAKVTAGINLIIGIWVFVSPWVYGAAGHPNAWNSWIVGALVILFSAIRLSNPVAARGVAWLNTILGVWLFFSPWIFGYTMNGGRMVNSLCSGVAIFVLSIYGATAPQRHITGTRGSV